MPRPLTGELSLAAQAQQSEFVHLLEFEFATGSLLMSTGTQDLITDPYALLFGKDATRYMIRNPVEAPWPTTAFTVEFWGRLASGALLTQTQWAISYASSAHTNHILFGLTTISSHLRLSLFVNGIETPDDANLDNDRGSWHHYAGTWDSSGGLLKLYRDGVLMHSATSVQSGHSITGGGALILGQDQDTIGGGLDGTQAWGGDMDNVRIYRRVLSDVEIAEHYVNRFSNEQQLVGLWKFDAPVSQTLINAGLETGDSTGWIFDQASVVNDGNARTGSYAIKYTGNGSGGPNQRNAGQLRVNPGDHVYVEAWVKTAAGTGTTTLAVRHYDASGAAVGGRVVATGIASITGPVASYTRLYGYVIAPLGAVYAELDIGENNADNTATPWYFDDFFMSRSVGIDSGPIGNHLSPVGFGSTANVTDSILRRLWAAVGGLLRFNGVEEGGDSRGQGVDVQLSGVLQTAIAVLMGGVTYRGRRVRIYRAHLSSTTGLLITDPLLLIDGLQLSPYEIQEDRDSREGGTVTVRTRVKGRMGVDRIRGIWSNLISHQHIFPGDTFFTHTALLQNSKVYWGTNAPTTVGSFTDPRQRR